MLYANYFLHKLTLNEVGMIFSKKKKINDVEDKPGIINIGIKICRCGGNGGVYVQCTHTHASYIHFYKYSHIYIFIRILIHLESIL